MTDKPTVEQTCKNIDVELWREAVDEISTNAVTADKIIAGAVTTAKISAGAITADKIGMERYRPSIHVTEHGTGINIGGTVITQTLRERREAVEREQELTEALIMTLTHREQELVEALRKVVRELNSEGLYDGLSYRLAGLEKDVLAALNKAKAKA